MSKRFELINFLNAHDNFKDNKNNKKLDSFDVVKLLNHYDKLQTLLVEKDQRIEELQKQLEEKDRLLQYGMTEIKKLHKRINDIVKRDEKLFKSQPAEIVDKIKKQIFNHFNVKNIEEYERLSLPNALFTADAVAEILDTILKEYQK